MSVDYSLHQPLPFQLRTGVHNRFTRYKDYPVFSFGWWWRRTMLMALLCFVLILAPTFAQWVNVSAPGPAFLVALLTMLSCMLSLNLGPGIASIERHVIPSQRWTGILIVPTIVVCTGLCLGIDYWLREICFEIMQPYPQTHAMSKALRNSTNSYSYLGSAVFFGLFGGGWAISGYYAELQRSQYLSRIRTEEVLKNQKLQTDLRLSVLQAQVEPHFLFNTLASIRALIRQAPDQSEATLDALVEYLRASIPKLRDNERSTSTLGQQLDLCANYLEVMRLRTSGRLRYAIEADAALRALPFPPMLLITLAENAIKHGIEPKRGPGQVTISAARDGDSLRVSVIDDGVGLQLGVGGGLGLANVRAQLDTLFDGRASFDLRNLPAGGVRAEMTVPVQGDAA